MARRRQEQALRKSGSPLLAAFLAGILAALSPQVARADLGGVSFWLPGAFGSLAATPLTPGWSFTTLYIHNRVSGGGDVAASRAINFPNRTVNLTANLDA